MRLGPSEDERLDLFEQLRRDRAHLCDYFRLIRPELGSSIGVERFLAETGLPAAPVLAAVVALQVLFWLGQRFAESGMSIYQPVNWTTRTSPWRGTAQRGGGRSCTRPSPPGSGEATPSAKETGFQRSVAR